MMMSDKEFEKKLQELHKEMNEALDNDERGKAEDKRTMIITMIDLRLAGKI